MKRIVIFIVLFTLSAAARSQIGLSGSYLNSRMSKKIHARNAFSLGGWFQVPVSKKVYWKQSVLYSLRGSGKETESDTNTIDNNVRSYNYNYLNFEAMFYYRFSKRASVGIGSSLSFLIKSVKKSEYPYLLLPGIKKSFVYDPVTVNNTIDLPLIIGAKYDLDKIALEIKYYHGTVPVTPGNYSRSLSVGLNLNLSPNHN